MLWFTSAFAHTPILYTFGPEDDWCGFLNGVEVNGVTSLGGDAILLTEGDYGPCTFEAPMPPENAEFTVVQSADRARPARFVHTGITPLIVSGQKVLFFDLVFEQIPAGGEGVRFEQARDAWVRFSTFEGAGTAVRFVEPVGDVRLTDSKVSTATGVEVLCHGCSGEVTVSNSWFETEQGVLGQASVVDSVFDTGAAMVLSSPSRVHGNLVRGTEGLRASGAPSVLNNIFDVTGVALELEAGEVLGNSVISGSVLGHGEFVNNAGPAEFGPNNRECGDCFDGFGPRGDSTGTSDPRLVQDFCGEERPQVPTAGALESNWGEWQGFKSDFDCRQPAPPTPFVSVENPAPGGCCATVPGSLQPWWIRRR